MKKPLIGITMGDPAGVGPELCLEILNEPAVIKKCVPIIFGDAGVLKRAARTCSLREPQQRIVPLSESFRQNYAEAVIINCRAVNSDVVRPGQIQPECGRAAYAYVECAVKAAMTNKIAGIVTAPINKKSLNLAGISYPGHTEMLAKLTGAKRFCMMFASDELKVSLATIHEAYSNVPSLLSVQRIMDVIELTVEALKRTGISSPRIGVCGLNPHAGEDGLFGNEEEKIIKPAIEKARRKGFTIEGPIPPDTAFLPEKFKGIDAYVAMYHDQGLIPFKMLAFDRGVNITLGLPIIRTSVDHGTAFDIAWQGKASPNSLIQAIFWAIRLSKAKST